MIVAADANEDGFVEYEDFERVLEEPSSEAAVAEVVEDMFQLMDRDGDGRSDSASSRRLCRWHGFIPPTTMFGP